MSTDRKDKDFNQTINIIKSKSTLERGLVYGIVYEPNVKDTDGDYATAEEIEKAAHSFLPRAMMNIQHEKDSSADVDVVESYIAPQDIMIPGSKELAKAGSWILVTKINDPELKKSIADGTITGYSLEGTAKDVIDV